MNFLDKFLVQVKSRLEKAQTEPPVRYEPLSKDPNIIGTRPVPDWTTKSNALLELLYSAPTDIQRLLAIVEKQREALERSANHWFNKNDPNDPYHDCACATCDMGEAGDETDERGHDLSCTIAICGRTLTELEELCK